MNDIIHRANDKALEALKLCVTDKGFSACSIAHDREKHTNYACVWSRDSAITTILTLPLHNPVLIDAAKTSLETILDAQADNGTLPNYIYIDRDEIEYGGVANIGAIDGAMWTIIAAMAYYDFTQDDAFITKYADHLERTYLWIAAHDTNNCGLLEIPESSDWADLMCRSFNVLHDEVLWYACTKAYARLKEVMNVEHDSFVARADFIKKKIIDVFHPTEDAVANHKPTHAHTQYKLVNTPYLVDQVGPHFHGWRCDVLANILAAMYDVTDPALQERTYLYLRQVEIDRPHPVRVLYPTIEPGDPMWRDYQLVKIHNAPHHYHNGGIWPVAGGLWVRFLLKLGKEDHAKEALERLADFCFKGVYDEWEFNEWGHGQTGNPMGKSYQAWSAASYISAYDEYMKHTQK